MNYSPFRHIGSIFRKKRPLQFTFFLTRRCNARCPFCFYLSHDSYEGQNSPELSLEEIEKIAGSLGPLLWLAFSGGEIFLRDDLLEITKIFYDRTKPAIILLPTNGLLPGVIREKTEAILEYCKKSTIVVKLSLDGREGLHDSLRGTEGAHDKTLETYSQLHGLVDSYQNFELGINTVFCSSNQGEMVEIMKSIDSLDRIRTHTVSLIRGNVSEETLTMIDPEKYRETIDQLEFNLKNRLSPLYRFRGARLKAAQDILQRRLIYRTLKEQRRLIPCYAGRLTLVLTEKGDLYPCESFRNRLGNVREDGYDINELVSTDGARTVIQSIRKNGCYCTHECNAMINILFNPFIYPSLLREYLQL
jgi:radical SAM protein with 4Fe4S-binding SPASM domain